MAAFEKIYEEYAKPVYRFLLSLTADEAMAEELLQETFYRALLHIDRFEGRCSLYTWLCQIGKNAWYKECKRKKRQPDISEAGLFDSVFPSAESQTIAKDEADRIRQAIKGLPQPYQDVFIMHVFGGIKLTEIAAIYHKSESWARVTYYRARQQLLQEVSL